MVKQYKLDDVRMIDKNVPHGINWDYKGVQMDHVPIPYKCQFCNGKLYRYRTRGNTLTVRCYGIVCKNNPDNINKQDVTFETQARVLKPELHWSPPPPLI